MLKYDGYDLATTHLRRCWPGQNESPMKSYFRALHGWCTHIHKMFINFLINHNDKREFKNIKKKPLVYMLKTHKNIREDHKQMKFIRSGKISACMRQIKFKYKLLLRNIIHVHKCGVCRMIAWKTQTN